MARRSGRPVKVWFTEEEYARLAEEARRRGYATVTDLVHDLVLEALEARPGAGQAGGADARAIAEAVARRVERVVADLVNPFTGKIDEVSRRLAELVEALEARGGEGAPAVEEEPAAAPSPPRRRGFQAYPRRRREGGGGSTALERLHEDGVVFEEEATWARDPDKYFSRMKERGAVVVELPGGRAAVDRELWERIVEEAGRIGVRDPEEAAALLRAAIGGAWGEKAARLFERLVKAGLAYYDEDEGRWVVEEG